MTSLPRGGIDGPMGAQAQLKLSDSRYQRLQFATWATGIVCSLVALVVLRMRKEGDSPLLEVVICLTIGIIPHAMMFRHEWRLLAPMASDRQRAYWGTILSRAFVPLNLLAYIYWGYFWVETAWGAAWIYLSLLANGYALIVPFGKNSRPFPILKGRFHPAAVAAYGLAELIIYAWWASGG